MKSILLDLVKINNKANKMSRDIIDKEFDDLVKLETPYGKFIPFVHHIFWAINLWLDRIKKEDVLYKNINEINTKIDLLSEWEKADKRWFHYMNNFPESTNFDEIIRYHSTSGEKFTTSLKEILLHMSHHSFYHRGQLAILLRTNNKTPLPPTDAIYYYRKGS